MTVFVVQYHSNAWCDQMRMDDILGIYSSEEAAKIRAAKFKKDLAWDDDEVTVCEYELDEDVLTFDEYELG